MKKSILLYIISACCLSINMIYAQNKIIIGLVDAQLVEIDQQSGQAKSYLNINRLPAGSRLVDLVFNEALNRYYIINNPTNNPTLYSISESGEFIESIPLTLSGKEIFSVESITYNPATAKTYLSASINSGIQQNDFYSETILKVDPQTGTCEFVTEISTSTNNPDIDAFTMVEDDFFIFDGAPPSANFLNFYTLKFENITALSHPTKVYSDNYLPIADLINIEDNIYFTADYNFYRYHIYENKIYSVGTTHSQQEFNNAKIVGLTTKNTCDPPSIALNQQVSLCDEESYIIDAYTDGATYLWEDGTTSPTLEVNISGDYIVEVSNSCGFIIDTVSVSFNTKPAVEIIEVIDPCEENRYLTIVNIDENTEYFWQNGSQESQILAQEEGVYKLIAKNNCGISTDSIYMSQEFIDEITIPNIITPNSDGKNDYFQVDNRLAGAQIIIYNRYGKAIYHENNYQNQWKGEGLPPANYFYTITDNCNKVYNGWIQLVR